MSHSYSLLQIIRVPKELRDLMLLSNDHGVLRHQVGLEPYLILDSHNFNASVEKSFQEIDQHLEEWGREPDPEEGTERGRSNSSFGDLRCCCSKPFSICRHTYCNYCGASRHEIAQLLGIQWHRHRAAKQLECDALQRICKIRLN